MNTFTLEFANLQAPELTRTCFTHPLFENPQCCVRGKTAGAFPTYGSFQWTNAVKALAILAIRACQSPAGSPDGVIAGGKGSLASSLDYSIDKECHWLRDMFGTDSHGRSLVRRLILRSNPGRKRPGPVILSINGGFLSMDSLYIFWDGMEITKTGNLKELEGMLIEQHDPLASEKVTSALAA